MVSFKCPKWIPHLRYVDDGPVDKSGESESAEESEKTPVQTVTEIEYEIRDEANRPWYKFFDEYEYRYPTHLKVNHRWWKWFEDSDSPAERKLLLKLDILLCFYSFMVYWVKYLDQTNLNNAYVSGMKESLGMAGNDLVIVQAMFTVGCVVFQIPFMYLFSHAPISYMLPFMDIGWGVFTLLLFRAQSVAELKAYRFFVGAFESAFYPAVHFLFGAWYKPSEYGRRGGIFYFGQMLGILTAGLIQSAAFKNLSGVNGLEGWRWMFIIDAIITFPIGIIGIWSIPGVPEKCYSVFLTDDEIRLARKRLRDANMSTGTTHDFFNKKLWLSIIKDWKIYVLTFWDILCWNNNNGTSGAYLLWMKSLNRFSVSHLNNLATITPALGILWIFLVCTSADIFRSRWGAIVVSQLFNFTGNAILAVWNVPEGAKWFAFMIQYSGWAMASVLYGWSNDICRRDAQERAVILIFMNLMAQQSTAWTSVLVWPTSEAPRYLKGFSFTATCAFLLAVWTVVVLWFYKREERKNAYENGIILYNSALGEEPPQVGDEHPKWQNIAEDQGAEPPVM